MVLEQHPHRLTAALTAMNSVRNRFTPQMVTTAKQQELSEYHHRRGVSGIAANPTILPLLKKKKKQSCPQAAALLLRPGSCVFTSRSDKQAQITGQECVAGVIGLRSGRTSV